MFALTERCAMSERTAPAKVGMNEAFPAEVLHACLESLAQSERIVSGLTSQKLATWKEQV